MISFQHLSVWLVTLLYICGSRTTHLNKKVSFTITSRENQTGHKILRMSFDKSPINISNQWKLNLEHTISDIKGKQTLHIDGIFSVPPTKPIDYELFPGVGFYKFHTLFANGFEDASSICSKEGGHLAIINSESEHQALQTLFARHPQNQLKTSLAFVGFHDRAKEGEYFTIFGTPLNLTGYTKWAGPNNPDNVDGIENCGSINRIGGLNDIKCNAQLPFFCEYDLSWNEI